MGGEDAEAEFAAVAEAVVELANMSVVFWFGYVGLVGVNVDVAKKECEVRAVRAGWAETDGKVVQERLHGSGVLVDAQCKVHSFETHRCVSGCLSRVIVADENCILCTCRFEDVSTRHVLLP